MDKTKIKLKKEKEFYMKESFVVCNLVSVL